MQPDQLDELAATVGGFATSFTTQHLTTHELCVDDTCVTKTQFEALLQMAAQHSESAAAANEPNRCALREMETAPRMLRYPT